MAIHYNVIQRAEPGVAGGGDKKYYASAIRPAILISTDSPKESKK